MVSRTTTGDVPPLSSNASMQHSSSSIMILPSKDNVEYYHAMVKKANRLHDLGIDLCYGTSDDRCDDALQSLYCAAHIREAILGKFHPDTALSYSRIASIQDEYRHNSVMALAAGRRELRISQELLKGDRNSIAEVDETRESWMVARLQWFEQVLDSIDVTELGTTQKKRYCSQLLQSIAMEQLGDQHVTIQEWVVAVTHYNNALTLESNAYGRNIVDAAEIHIKISDCLIRIKDYDGAMDELINAEKKYRQAFPSSTEHYDHRTVGDVYRKMAALLLLQRKFDDALAKYAKAYTILEDTYGTTHHRPRDVLADLKLVTVREMEQIRHDSLKRTKKGRKK